MAHRRNRYLEQNLKKCMALSPLVGIVGHRQVGKTTVLEQFSKKYFSLDKKELNQAASQQPETFLKQRAGNWVGLDECQTVPALFPELKDWVRTHPKPGQFLLSGSIRFTSREAIKESLTGRIINLELLPFTVSEIEELSLSSFCPDLIETSNLKSFTSRHYRSRAESKKLYSGVKKYFELGGLPGICFVRETRFREQKINDYLNTMLDRDLRMVKRIQISLGDIRSVLRALAKLQGQAIDFTQIKNETSVSTPTIKKIIYALEAIFIIRTIAIQGSVKGHTLFFEDMAEYRSLLDDQPSKIDILNHFCFTQLRAQFNYRLGEITQLHQYKTRSGAEIPLVFSNKHGTLGVISIEDPESIATIMGSVNSFLKTYSNAKALVVHQNHSEPTREHNSRVVIAPIGQVI